MVLKKLTSIRKCLRRTKVGSLYKKAENLQQKQKFGKFKQKTRKSVKRTLMYQTKMSVGLSCKNTE